MRLRAEEGSGSVRWTEHGLSPPAPAGLPPDAPQGKDGTLEQHNQK